MQPDDKTLLCASENGSLSVFNTTVAYELRFRQSIHVFHSEQIVDMKEALTAIPDEAWFATENTRLLFFSFTSFAGNFILYEEDVQELLQLLSEALAMIKVHHRLYFKPSSKAN